MPGGRPRLFRRWAPRRVPGPEDRGEPFVLDTLIAEAAISTRWAGDRSVFARRTALQRRALGCGRSGSIAASGGSVCRAVSGPMPSRLATARATAPERRQPARWGCVAGDRIGSAMRRVQDAGLPSRRDVEVGHRATAGSRPYRRIVCPATSTGPTHRPAAVGQGVFDGLVPAAGLEAAVRSPRFTPQTISLSRARSAT